MENKTTEKVLKLLIVLHNKRINDSETCVSLMSLSDMSKFIKEIHIWNNSNFRLSNQEKLYFENHFDECNICWWGDNLTNTPLSIIYNYIISIIDSTGFLVLWDHDTVITKDYIKKIISSANIHKEINLFLPQIRYNDNLVSPAMLYYFYGRYYKTISSGYIKARFLSVINSGMAIRCSFLKNDFVGYNEKINFYGTDNDFMYKYSRKNKYAYILDTEIKHTLNYYHNFDLDDKIKRYQDIKNGMYEQMKSIHIVMYILSIFYMFLYSIKMDIKYKTLKFH